MERVVTLKDIAEAAGVGKGTVDRVLHNRGRVSEETRQRVLQCVQELGYKPNMAARMLAKRKVYRIAVTFHNMEKEFWDQVLEGIDRAEAEYRQLGVEVHRFILPEMNLEAQEKIILKVIEERFDALAIVPYYSKGITEALEKAAAAGIKIIVFNNDEKCTGSIYVGDNTRQSGRTAGRMMSLIAPRGARYAVAVPGIEIMASLDLRYKGFREIVDKARPDMHMVELINANNDYSKAYTRVKELLSENAIDAIYATNVISLEAARAVEECRRANQIRIVGHDLIPSVQEAMRKGLIDVSIGQEPSRQGYLAVSLLCRQLLQEEELKEDVYTNIVIAVSENEGYYPG